MQPAVRQRVRVRQIFRQTHRRQDPRVLMPFIGGVLGALLPKSTHASGQQLHFRRCSQMLLPLMRDHRHFTGIHQMREPVAAAARVQIDRQRQLGAVPRRAQQRPRPRRIERVRLAQLLRRPWPLPESRFARIVGRMRPIVPAIRRRQAVMYPFRDLHPINRRRQGVPDSNVRERPAAGRPECQRRTPARRRRDDLGGEVREQRAAFFQLGRLDQFERIKLLINPVAPNLIPSRKVV